MQVRVRNTEYLRKNAPFLVGRVLDVSETITIQDGVAVVLSGIRWGTGVLFPDEYDLFRL